ncbi:MAG: hypothetical protein ACRD2W_10355 [Acidimicrobiales bacterium]
MRAYAVERLDPALDDEARAAATRAIDDAVYGLMMVIDGVTGGLRGGGRAVEVDFTVGCAKATPSRPHSTSEGDGFCMG